MNAKERNQLYWRILNQMNETRTFLHNRTNYFALPHETRNLLEHIADGIKIPDTSKTTGRTRSQTLWYRAIEGRPF